MSVLLPPLIVQDLFDCFHQLYPLVVKVYSALFPPWIKMSFLLSYIIVLAGKGHEDYQEIKGVKYPMDERVLIKEVLEELKGN